MITAILIFVLTLIFVLWQPRGLGIGWSALAGAAFALLFGVVHTQDISAVWSIIWDPTMTFIGLIVISLLLDEAGFFAWCAIHVALWGKGNGTKLFLLIILLGASVSAIFANDGTALILTPIVLSVLLSLGFSPKNALAFILATGFVADSTSLPLVISNLVNILSADYFHKSFGEYAKVMVPVNFAALGSTLLISWIYFKRSLPASYNLMGLPPPNNQNPRQTGLFGNLSTTDPFIGCIFHDCRHKNTCFACNWCRSHTLARNCRSMVEERKRCSYSCWKSLKGSSLANCSIQPGDVSCCLRLKESGTYDGSWPPSDLHVKYGKLCSNDWERIHVCVSICSHE